MDPTISSETAINLKAHELINANEKAQKAHAEVATKEQIARIEDTQANITYDNNKNSALNSQINTHAINKAVNGHINIQLKKE